MSAGLRFGAGPLRVYIPPGRRKRRGPKRKRPPLGPVGVAFCVLFAVSFVIFNHTLPRQHTKPVSRIEQPGNWPLTIDAGVLSCKNGRVLFTAGGTTYVQDPRPGDPYADINQIAASASTAFPERKVDVSIFLSEGTTLC